MLRLITFTVCKETVGVLQHMLRRATKGELRGVALAYWTVGGGSEVVLTGAYRAQPEHALSAADLIKVTAAHQLDLFA
jgi:hypothetical protein